MSQNNIKFEGYDLWAWIIIIYLMICVSSKGAGFLLLVSFKKIVGTNSIGIS